MKIIRPRAIAVSAVSAAYLAAHALAVCQRTFDPMLLSYLFQIGAPLAAAAIAWTMGRADHAAGPMRWRLVASGFVLWASGMFLSMREDLAGDVYAAASGYGVAAYVLYGVPLLLVLATPPAEWASRLIRAIDASMVVILTALILVNTYKLGLPGVVADDEQLAGFITMFDAENLLLLVFASVRLMAAGNRSARALYGSLSAYALVYFVVALYYNRYVVGTLDAPAGSLNDVLIDLPYVAFALAALAIDHAATNASSHANSRLRRFIAAVPPFFLTITVVIVAILSTRQSFYIGTTGAVLAILGYGVRSTLQQVHQIGATHSAERDRDAIAGLVWSDALTGIRNRRAFDAALDLEWDRARRTEHSLGLLMIDIDHFKTVNDQLGHVAGDHVIRQVGKALESAASLSSDVLARYGGEEFACLLPDTTVRKAQAVAERMRRAIEDLAIGHPDSPHAVLTVSVGVASLVPTNATDPRSLVEAADRALYAAKSGGRNRVTA